MIENVIPKTIVNIALIMTTIIVGVILHKLGRPYSNVVFAIHKLTTVIFVVLIIRIIIPYANNHELNILPIVLIVLATISVLGLIVSGGAMSLNKSHDLMLTIHKVSTLVFLLIISGLFYTIYQIKN